LVQRLRRRCDVLERGQPVARDVHGMVDALQRAALLRQVRGAAALARDVQDERPHLVDVGVPGGLLLGRELQVLAQLLDGLLERVYPGRLALRFLRSAARGSPAAALRRRVRRDQQHERGDHTDRWRPRPHSRYEGSILSSLRSSAGHSSTPKGRRVCGRYSRCDSSTIFCGGSCSSTLHASAATCTWQARSSRKMLLNASGMLAPTTSSPWLRRIMPASLPRSRTRRSCSSALIATPS